MHRTWLLWLTVACTDKTVDPYGGIPRDDLDADTDTDTDTDTDSDTDTDTDTDVDPKCLVTLAFTGEIVTVTGSPFGFSDDDRLQPASGSLTYDRCVADTYFDEESKTWGEYDHWGRASSAFELVVEGKTATVDITGSTTAVARIENLDTFRFWDGGYDVVDSQKRYRTMSLDGKPDSELEISLSIGSSDTLQFDSDALPEQFPYQGKSEDDFACQGGQDDFCVTFTAGYIGGETELLSFTLDSLQQVDDK